DCRRRIDNLTARIDILEREEAISGGHAERLATLSSERAAAQAELAELERRWKDEARLVTEMRAIRDRLEAGRTNGQGLGDAERTKLRADLDRLGVELTALQGETPLMQVCVDRQAVSEVISGWTGIPVGKMLRDEIKTVLTLRETLEERVVGQSHALDAI